MSPLRLSAVVVLAALSISPAWAGVEVIRTHPALAAYTKEYFIAYKHKAFAQSPSGSWAWRAERTSPEFAQQDALAACESFRKEGEAPCVVINVDDESVKPAR